MKTRFFLIFLLLLLTSPAQAAPLDTAFTYQGELKQTGVAANGDFDFQFELYDTEIDGLPLTAAVLLENITVSDGIFTVELDFGLTPFAGDQLWLEIAVREGASSGGYTGLLPRQKITPVPFALHTLSVAANSVGAAEVDNSQVQLRVGGSCTGFSAIESIAADGTVNCENNLLPKGRNINCSRNQKVTGLNGSNGDVICGEDIDTDTDTNTNAATICPNGYFLNGDGTCDLADGTGNCGAGRVCTGGHGHSNYVPQTSGDAVIGAGDYTHSTRNGYIHVPGSTLTPVDPAFAQKFETSPFFISPYDGGTTYAGNAAINPPDGAIINSITGYYYDNQDGVLNPVPRFQCILYYRALTGTSLYLVVKQDTQVNWTASTSIRTVTSGTVSHTVDKGVRAYLVYGSIGITDGTTDFRHYGCRVNYTYTNTNK